jgi:hypothetical protein
LEEKKMKKFIGVTMFMMAMSTIVYGYTYSDYDWHDYGGHEYALTLNVGTWEQAEDEAQALNLNYHLVTINISNENDFLSATFDPVLTEHGYYWIGFYQDHSDSLYSEPSGGWKWISGEPVTFTGWMGFEPNNQGQEDYGTLVHNSPWNDWGPGASEGYDDIYGIIETPEPATILLFGLGGLALLRKRRK